MVTQQGRHHCDSDLDEPLAKAAKTSVSELLETSKAHDISHNVSDLFEDTQSFKQHDSDADILDDIDDPFIAADKVGPSVRPKLADKVNSHFKTALSYDIIQGKQREYVRPENCSKLSVPRCNDEIWKKLTRFQKRKYVRMANIQRALSASGTAITQVIENLLSAAKSRTTMDIPVIVSKATDALALISHGSHDVLFCGREMLAHTPKSEYAALASPAVPVTDFLFGDVLLKTMRHLVDFSHFSGSRTEPVVQKWPVLPSLGKKRGHGSTKKTGAQVQAQAHTLTATTPVQLTTLVSVNSIIKFQDKTEFFDNVNNVTEQCRYEIKHFKAVTSDESI